MPYETEGDFFAKFEKLGESEVRASVHHWMPPIKTSAFKWLDMQERIRSDRGEALQRDQKRIAIWTLFISLLALLAALGGWLLPRH